ncbi:uncharacterized protein CLUP02_15938 [Colletotrichum lupini]|uniref:Uncharacterized protein n=1 Tax=Colletotrichum lupini TaxID=145971 RepID=A0A9Q8T7M5_9PEZI|nr:uncharacterized protein CLUP02_15938 [Colletotrichum lupini]UQC90408.1 hypothetical protein CLUP02_15938 [Colletotrichum lupini]
MSSIMLNCKTTQHQDCSICFSNPAKMPMVLGIPRVAHKVSPIKYRDDYQHQFVRRNLYRRGHPLFQNQSEIMYMYEWALIVSLGLLGPSGSCNEEETMLTPRAWNRSTAEFHPNSAMELPRWDSMPARLVYVTRLWTVFLPFSPLIGVQTAESWQSVNIGSWGQFGRPQDPRVNIPQPFRDTERPLGTSCIIAHSGLALFISGQPFEKGRTSMLRGHKEKQMGTLKVLAMPANTADTRISNQFDILSK